MRSGNLTKRITIQYQTKVSDGMGGSTSTWVDYKTVFAQINPLSSHRKTEAMQQGLNASHQITIRYLSVFKASWRIKFGNRYFSISGITNPYEENKELDILCLEAAG
jgi:SPP1 family predicted phage head-tail adaptor